jgi:hypothetical protein
VSGYALLGQALVYASRGWPVFPCKPGLKAPDTPHGFQDATTDPAVIRAWWAQHPRDNVAIATGAPAVDVLDVDVKPGGDGFAAYGQLGEAGLLAGACAMVRTRSGGLHVYFTGTGQGCGKLAAHHLDFKAAGGYVLAPPSFVDADDRGPAGTYELIEQRDAAGRLDWQAACRLLEPPPPPLRPRRRAAMTGKSLDGVVRYLSGLQDGEQRWRQLYWGACRAAELIAAGKLGEPEAREALMEAARANGFAADHGEREALRKIDRGLRDGAR